MGGGNLRVDWHSSQGSYICEHNYLLHIISSFQTVCDTQASGAGLGLTQTQMALEALKY